MASTSVEKKLKDLCALITVLKIKKNELISVSARQFGGPAFAHVDIHTLLRISRQLSVPRRNVRVDDSGKEYVHVTFIAGGVEWTGLLSREERESFVMSIAAEYPVIGQSARKGLGHEPRKLAFKGV